MTIQELNRLYVDCRTYRRFTQEPVADEALAQLVENARIASSAMNQLATRCVVLKSPEAVAGMHSLVRYAGSLPKELGTPTEEEQPTAFIVLLADAKAPAPWVDYDLGIVANTIATTAWAAGYASCILGAIDKEGIRAHLAGRADGLFGGEPLTAEQVRLAIALGRPDHRSTLVEGPQEDGSMKYYLDEARNYYVPKRKTEDMSVVL